MSITMRDMEVALRDLIAQADIMACHHSVCTPHNCAIIRAEKLLEIYENEQRRSDECARQQQLDYMRSGISGLGNLR